MLYIARFCFYGTYKLSHWILVQAVRLVEKYLASIPPCQEPVPVPVLSLKAIPFRFPASPVEEDVKVSMAT